MLKDVVTPDTGLVPLSRVPWNKAIHVKLNEKSLWLANLLAELSENVGDVTAMVGQDEFFLRFDADLYKKRHPMFGEILIVEGAIESTFPTLCSVTGAVMTDHTRADVKCCFIHQSFKKQAEDPMEEEIELMIDDQIFDLYFYAPRGAGLEEMIHEYLYLNKNPYPKLESESDGAIDEEIVSILGAELDPDLDHDVDSDET